jgi:FKBP-type peptidyl-prolyl cis-trans isomerase
MMKLSWENKSGMIIFGVGLVLLLLQAGVQAGKAQVVSTPSGLQYVDLVTGNGKMAKTGDMAVVHYTGWLKDGTKFDSSKDRNKPFQFSLGAGRVIKGWDEGVVGMKIGGKRKLIIPPELGYGARGAGRAIPPNATLTFEVELLDLR